jgi:hypothetical protein
LLPINQPAAKKTIIKKDWKNLKGFGAYLGNMYVLDAGNNTIYKFASGSYNKTTYLTAKVDVSKGVDVTIDGSIWVLLSDGNILKLTKGGCGIVYAVWA